MQILKKISILLSFSFATIINIPADYSSIQIGINNAFSGDTILVSDGDYVENLIIDKSIVLASNAIFDNLDDWIAFDDLYFNQWVVDNSHILNTRIIGNNPTDPSLGSTILIAPSSNECISPEIIGFTITGGQGTSVYRPGDELGEFDEVKLGGAILADISNPYIHHNAIINSGSNEVLSGGGVYLTSEPEDFGFENRLGDFSPRCDIDSFSIPNNFFNGNDAQYGNTLANTSYIGEFDMSESIFDVYDCTNQTVSSVWVDTEPEADIDFDDSEGLVCAFIDPNVYVNPTLNQECFDEGCGVQSNPFKTISRALEMISPTETNPITINLLPGTFVEETLSQNIIGTQCFDYGGSLCYNEGQYCVWDCNYSCIGYNLNNPIGNGVCDDDGPYGNYNCAEFNYEYGECDSGGGNDGCGANEIEDCNGNCAPSDWLGDGFCDDGQYSYNGNLIYLNCNEFQSDNGDCSSVGFCGDSICDSDENSNSCPEDCAGSEFYPGQNCCDIPSIDCSDPNNASYIGTIVDCSLYWCVSEDNLDNGFCDSDDSVGNLNCSELNFDEGDCVSSYCGDGVCDSDENSNSCPEDCASQNCGANEIEDCNGNCSPSDWLGDGYCDDGAYSYNGNPIYFNCDEFQNDSGDCGSSDPQLGDNCDGTYSDGSTFDGNIDCNDNCAPSDWLGDGYCDDGEWGAYFNCSYFNFDEGDCTGREQEVAENRNIIRFRYGFSRTSSPLPQIEKISRYGFSRTSLPLLQVEKISENSSEYQVRNIRSSATPASDQYQNLWMITNSNRNFNEYFPIRLISNINLSGSSLGEVFFDGEGLNPLIFIDAADNITVSNITFKRGNNSGGVLDNDGRGSVLTVTNSRNINFENLDINNNVTNPILIENSDVFMSEVDIHDNIFSQYTDGGYSSIHLPL